VTLFARWDPARLRVDPEAYAALRGDLIAACRSPAEAEAERRPDDATLEETVRSWISPRVLAGSDPDFLLTLLVRCRELEWELGLRRRVLWWPLRHGGVWSIATLTPTFDPTFALLTFDQPAVVALRDSVDAAWTTLKFADDMWK
jgi:hypothetical protein